MDSSERDASSLRDIQHAADLIGSFVQGETLATFRQNARTRAAVLHELMVIGEATNRLSKEFRDRHGDVAWGEIAGMRDIIVHQYDRISSRIAWETATEHVPRPRTYVETVLESLED